MKKYLLSVFLILALQGWSQKDNWFISISTGAVLGGPTPSLYQKMMDQRFNQTSQGSFLGLMWTVNYPHKNSTPYLKLLAGKKMATNKSAYLITGIAGSGRVTGYKLTGGYVDLGFFGSTTGDNPVIDYSVYQIGGGLFFHFEKSRIKMGAAPSAFIFSYKSGYQKKSSVCISPGMEGTIRLPLGKEKKMFGIDLMAHVIAAAPVNPDLNKNLAAGEERTAFNATGTSLLQAALGIAFSLRQ